MSRIAWSRVVPGGALRTSGIAALVVAVSLAVTACAADIVPTPSPTVPSEPRIDQAQRAALVQKCVEDAEIGTVEAIVADARVAQRADGRWLVSVPIKYEALSYGEQHCVIVDASDGLRREGVEDGPAWADGDFEKWLEADRLWWE